MPSDHESYQDLRRNITSEYHLDDAIIVQYFHYIWDTLRGDFRTSISYMPGVEISEFIWDRASFTLVLLIPTIAVAILLGTAVEWLASTRKGNKAPLLFHLISLAALSAPAFALGLFLLYLNSSLDLGFPYHGNGFSAWDPDSPLAHAVLPFAACIVPSTGMFVLLARAFNSQDVEGSIGGHVRAPGIWLRDFIRRTASMRQFLYFFVAATFATVLIVEKAFSYGGLGSTWWEAATRLDIGLQMACFALIASMAFAINIVLGILLHVANSSKLKLVTSDWMERESTTLPVESAKDWRPGSETQWISRALRACVRSKAFVIALAVLAAMTAVGALAPVLATVEDPTGYTNLEPDVREDDWINPLDPSLERSPYTGFLHPLGTDAIGRDVYSMWLYSAREEMFVTLILMAAASALGIAIGLAAEFKKTMGGIGSRAVDFVLTTFARAIVAIPMMVLLGAVVISLIADGVRPGRTVVALFLIISFYLWAWVLIAKPVRRQMSASQEESKEPIRRRIIVAESLAVAKFAVPLTIIALTAMADILGHRAMMTWGHMFEEAWSWNAFATGDWHLLIPPIAGLMLLIAATFAVFDRAEFVVRNLGSPTSQTSSSGEGDSSERTAVSRLGDSVGGNSGVH